jgi:hypothetical protein
MTDHPYRKTTTQRERGIRPSAEQTTKGRDVAVKR